MKNLVVVLAATATALSGAVRTDFDKRTDFAGFRTFAWGEADGADGNSGRSLTPGRVRDNVAGELNRRGLREDTANPDVILTARIATGNERARFLLPGPDPTMMMFYRRPMMPMRWRGGFGRGGYGMMRPGFGYGFGHPYAGYGYGGGFGFDRVVEHEYVAGEIVLEMVDTRTNELVWRAEMTGSGNSAAEVHSEKAVAKAVRDAFKKFPVKAAEKR